MVRRRVGVGLVDVRRMCVDVRRLHRDCGRIKDRSWSGEGGGFVWVVACVLVLYLAGRRFSDCVGSCMDCRIGEG